MICGGRGIGRGTSVALGLTDARIALTDRRDYLKCLVKAVTGELDPISILVSNAGSEISHVRAQRSLQADRDRRRH